MASLNKLAIRGIRSFDDKQLSVIEFFSPVTVIVGHNGSGKTTIIECLKYATTGDQPPGTRGGAFVHDPKMANEKEVKAQVKLRFHAANGQRMLAVRNLSVTMKKTGALTMKTLESILALADGNVEKGGKRGVISTKCAEMDAEIPNLLGVSKAVLENVIFCHQEDSHWPLSEPATLKKKFDDIFEATKYTKALDNIKAIRKERASDQKAEKERLDGLLREKTHADKLKSRIADLNSSIGVKELEYEEAKNEYDRLVHANNKFYESATRFREIYSKVEDLTKTKQRYENELADARENLQELDGTDAELQQRLKNFDDHVMEQKRKRKSEESRQLDVEDELANARKTHVDLVGDQGRLQAQLKAQEQLIADREELIRDIGAKHQIKGYDHSPLEREKIIEFITRLNDLQKAQNQETDRLQADSRSKSDVYNTKLRQLHNELERYKQRKENIRDRNTKLQSSIATAESEVDAAQEVTSKLRTLQADMEDKQRRLQTTKDDIKSANYEERSAEKTSKSRSLETRRDELNAELRTLSLQADSRAKLDIKRSSLKSKTTEVKTTLDINKAKYRKLVGTDPNPDTMGREVERVYIEKDREHFEWESQSNIANKNLQAAETLLSTLKEQVKEKREDMKKLDKELRSILKGNESPAQAIESCQTELYIRKEEVNKNSGSHDLYKSFLRDGRNKRRCPLCERDMNNDAIEVFDTTLKEKIKKSSPEVIKETEEEIADWEGELKHFQGVAVTAGQRDKLKNTEIPALEAQIKEQEAKVPDLTEKAEEALRRLTELKKELKDIQTMREHAVSVSNIQKEIGQLKREITDLEVELSSTGSTKTADDVQHQLDALQDEIRVNEREKQSITVERERQLTVMRKHESDLHSMQLQESEYKSQLRDKSTLERRIEEMRKEQGDSTGTLKELDANIAEAQAPIQRLEQEYSQVQRDWSEKISRAQRQSQELNMSVDKLEAMNKRVERQAREKVGRQLKECNEKIEEFETEIQKLHLQVEDIRNVIQGIDKEINEAGASIANLRENIRVRKLIRDITGTQAEIDTYDMEEAAKAKRNFTDKYAVEKQKETDMQSKYAHIGGELSSFQGQLKQLEADFKEFKDINKKYRDQLVKVKLSDMANNDLEKYAKALDNAIMKYHSLKMEEVNDTMRHLWNKTYQGTDIDGIKISSDNEGGASKRSYNYRVVMTKDQVEMDMRGRCSAGQKMLASIIIRLALADSFGQNCGILALDEPTNALDTENIDALAESLIDIINERKNQGHFQLIIITHDENFLRKLGQSDVMEYYWRVSRDSRQKSVIERHRFG